VKKKTAKAARKKLAKKNHTDRLLSAVVNYVHKEGGKLVLVGGIEIQKWPGAALGQFKVAIECLGSVPSPSQPKGG
jgi:hypothetical protein